MNSKPLYLFTRTPLHVGGGSSVGAIDLPIQRERHTRHPIIPGSSIKGVLRYVAGHLASIGDGKVDDMFGPDSAGRDSEARAGDITFSEARPVAFPVRSAKGSFGYITCPIALQRFARDRELSELPTLPEVVDQHCYSGAKVRMPAKNKVVLEEYAFSNDGDFPMAWQDALKGVIDDPVWREMPGRLVLVSDGDFSHFVSSATEISHHIKIDPKTGAVARGALFSLECVPAETLFSATVTFVKRGSNGNGSQHYKTDCEAELANLLAQRPILQLGGNSTTGRGFCSVKLG
jgi:CRISPR-associated protein Cmr4